MFRLSFYEGEADLKMHPELSEVKHFLNHARGKRSDDGDSFMFLAPTKKLDKSQNKSMLIISQAVRIRRSVRCATASCKGIVIGLAIMSSRMSVRGSDRLDPNDLRDLLEGGLARPTSFYVGDHDTSDEEGERRLDDYRMEIEPAFDPNAFDGFVDQKPLSVCCRLDESGYLASVAIMDTDFDDRNLREDHSLINLEEFDPDEFGDFAEVEVGDWDAYDDDYYYYYDDDDDDEDLHDHLHEDLLQKIGALERGGKRWV